MSVLTQTRKGIPTSKVHFSQYIVNENEKSEDTKPAEPAKPEPAKAE